MLFRSTASNAQQNYGLIFRSFEFAPEERTSLVIGDKKTISLGKNASFSFDIYFEPSRKIYFGYIFRMVNEKGKDLNLIYDEERSCFLFTVDGRFTGVNFSVPAAVLYHKWTNIKLVMAVDSTAVFLNNKYLSGIKTSLDATGLTCVFGTGNDGHFITSDAPPMVIRNIRFFQKNKLTYYWPLYHADDHGITLDSLHNFPARTVHAVWASSMHSHWRKLGIASYKGRASIAFDPDQEKIYVVGDDSVYRLSIDYDSIKSKAFVSKDYHLFPGNQSFYNPVDKKLYSYYVDNHLIDSFSFSDGRWNKSIDTVSSWQYSQANHIFSPADTGIYVIGGYGLLTYKNKVQFYSFTTGMWTTLDVKGDFFMPRYLAGGARAGDSIYILGGYGSRSGDQMLSPQYLYDLMLYDIKKHTFKKVYGLANPDSSVIFGGAMVIDSANQCYYIFAFPNERFNSKLQLIRGSLKKPSYELVADNIPYSFQDVRSGVELFCCPKSNRLLAVTYLFNADEGQTDMQIYSIAFPPDNEMTGTAGVKNNSFAKWRWEMAFLIALACAALWSLFSIRTKKAVSAVKKSSLDQEGVPLHTSGMEPIHFRSSSDAIEVPKAGKETERNVIHLFGAFEIIDGDGHDISIQFSPLLKELFLAILLYSVNGEGGISSAKLNEMFWGGKASRDANNNRSVNTAKLKSLLEKIDSLNIKKVDGKWMIDFDPGKITIDLVDYHVIMEDVSINEVSRARKIIAFLKRGSFLTQTEYDWLDNIKANISNKIIDELLAIAKRLKMDDEVELGGEIANTIFNFDPINEEALRIKCKTLVLIGRHSLAKNCYEHFYKEYHKMYGETFAIPFNEIIAS